MTQNNRFLSNEQQSKIEAHSLEPEMMVLGCMINSGEAFFIGKDCLSEEDFFDSIHKIIFNAILNTKKEKEYLDIHLLGEFLKNINKLNYIGGFPYLMNLSNYAGTSAHMTAYCNDLIELTKKRNLVNICQNLGNELIKNIKPEFIIKNLQNHLEFVQNRNIKKELLYKYLLEPLSEQMIIEEFKNISPGVRIGIQIGEVDLKLPGGAITILAGATGHGKTTVAINFSLNFLSLNPKSKMFFFSFEENRATILSSFLNTFLNQELSKNNREAIKSYFQDGHPPYVYTEKKTSFIDKKNEFFKSLIETNRLNILYNNYSTEELIEIINFLKEKTNVGLIVIDYFQLLRLLKKKPNLSRQEELKEICLLLKDCAVETGLPILLTAQFNRTVTCEGDLSPIAIAEAADIERIANLILGIWNRNCPGLNKEGNKSKNGNVIEKEPTIYIEVLKGREIGIGHSSIFPFDGNLGKLFPIEENYILSKGPSHEEELSDW